MPNHSGARRRPTRPRRADRRGGLLREEIPAGEPRVGRQAGQRQQRRREVDEAGRGLGDLSRRNAPGPADQKRDADRRVVEEEAVGLLAMLAEAFAMVRGDDEDRPRGVGARVDRVEEPPELRVDEGDLAVVGVGGEPLFVPGRSDVRIVRVEEVKPEEEGAGAGAAEPGEGLPDPLVGGGGSGEKGIRLVRVGRPVVPGRESPVEAEDPVQDEGGDEAAGVPSRGAEPLGQRRHRKARGRLAVVDEAMGRRFEPCQDRRVGGEGQRAGEKACRKRIPSRATRSMAGVSACRRP